MSMQPPQMPPAQAPMAPTYSQSKIDNDHLRLISIFHFVMAGFSAAGLLFILAHFAIMRAVFTNPDMWKNQQGGSPPPDEFFAIFQWMYLFIGLFILAIGIGNFLSALYLRKKKNRTFSMIVAGINCMNMPLGTVLGVFTFIVLLRNSVREAYGEVSSTQS